jgi:tetraacyldisaccharide 4'-kinase
VVGRGTAARTVAEKIAARPDRPVLSAQIAPDPACVARLAGQRVLAFAGIGDPERFFKTLRAAGIDVARERTFPDHHSFSQGDLEALIADAKREGLTLVTTEKDLARLRQHGELPAWADQIVAFQVTLEFDDAVRLRKFLAARLFRAREKRFRSN